MSSPPPSYEYANQPNPSHPLPPNPGYAPNVKEPPKGYPQGPPNGPPPGYPLAPSQGYVPVPSPGYPQGTPPSYSQGPPPGYPQGPFPPGQPPGAPCQTQGMSAAPTVHTTNIVYTAVGGYGPEPAAMKCTYCQADIETSIHHELGMLTWIIVCSFFIVGFLTFGLTWLCCCIPCCIPSCKDVVHTCPNCKRQLGRYSRVS